MMQLELRHLRYFLAVAEELNFSRAAERLHIAQPALSAQIRSLETQLGTELFSRTTRKVDLTPAGELLLADAREIVERADRAAAKVAAAARGDRGTLRVAFAAHGAGETSNEIFRRFAEEYPGIDVVLVESATLEGLQQLVADHEADAAFAWLPVLNDELESEIVFSEPKAVAMHPEHLLAAQEEVRPEDLESEPIVSSWEHYSPATTAYSLAPFRRERSEIDLHATSVDACLSLVARGVAVYVVPESAQRFYGRPDVVYRPLTRVEPASVALVWHRETQNAAVAPFVEIARQVIADKPIKKRAR
jgi:DNA-binding transcriptional LysR family regulator